MLISDDAFPLAAAAERRLDRRRFLGLAGCAALLTAVGEWMAARAEDTAAPIPVALPAPGAPAPGAAVALRAADGREALAVRLADGTLVAFDRRCPHLGCPVLWAPERERFECPCHRAAFDARTGRVLFGPPRRGLAAATLTDAAAAERITT